MITTQYVTLLKQFLEHFIGFNPSQVNFRLNLVFNTLQSLQLLLHGNLAALIVRVEDHIYNFYILQTGIIQIGQWGDGTCKKNYDNYGGQ